MYKINSFYMAIAVLLLSTSAVSAESNTINSYPMFKDGILTIPRIDTPDQPGEFQNAAFQYTEKGNWTLLNYEAANKDGSVEQVKLVMTDSFPVQVFLNIQGLEECKPLGPVNQQLVNNRFEVTVNEKDPYVKVDCIFINRKNYEINFPLQVYGLTQGTYEYSVNGGNFVGKFVLAKDNALPLTIK